MTLQNVRDRFAALAELGMSEMGEWDDIITDAFTEIERRVLSDYDNEGNCRLLEAAAAALAFYNYRTILSARREVSSFKAGDVSVQMSDDGVNGAYRLLERAFAPIECMLEGSEFVFGRVDELCSES